MAGVAGHPLYDVGASTNEDISNIGVPDFVIPGAQRCGTYSLWLYLAPHPETCLAEFSPDYPVKEINFFSLLYGCDKDRFYKALVLRMGKVDAEDLIALSNIHTLKDYYCYLFRNKQDGQLTYDASADYFHTLVAPERLARANPNVKIIVMMRNPIDRAVSQYWYEQLSGLEKESLEGALFRPRELRLHDNIAAYLEPGCYYDLIQHWNNYLPKENFSYIHAESFFENPEPIFLGIQQFLGFKTGLKLTEYEKANAREYPPFEDKKLRDRLREYFKPHNEKLYNFLGKDLGWN